MVRRKWIPTPLGVARPAMRTVVPEPPSSRRGWDITCRSIRVVWLLIRRRSPAVIGQAVRGHCEALGGLWVKVGQLLSLRLDVFPAAFCEALTGLQSRAVGFPGTQARFLVDRELQALGRGSLTDVFDHFDPEPIAAASVSQVHRARLRCEGIWVAVKVQRPFAVDTFTADLASLAVLVRLVRLCRTRYRPDDFLAELRRVVDEELDFRFEATWARQMRKILKPHGIDVPKLFRHYSSAQVIVSEWVDGVVMADYLDLLEQEPGAAAAWCAANRVRPTRVARLLIQSLWRQIYEDNRVHVDLHPGNILLLRRNRIVLLDFGTMTTTERDTLATFCDQAYALATGQYQWAAENMCLLTRGVSQAAFGTATDDLVQVMQTWAKRAEIRTLPYHEKSMNVLMRELMRVVRQAGGYMPWTRLSLWRAVSTLDASLSRLDPAIHYPREQRRYFSAAERRSPRLLEIPRLLDRAADYLRLEGAATRYQAFHQK